MAGSEHSVRPRRAAQPAVLANSARRGTNAAAYCGQNPPRQGRGALTRARSSGGLVISRPPGRHTGSVPRGSPLHCLDSIEDTRARHDAPSPRPVRHRDRAPGWPSWPALAADHRPAAGDGAGRNFLPVVQSGQRRPWYNSGAGPVSRAAAYLPGGAPLGRLAPVRW